MKLYVAYGSNLNIKQMGTRCPSATIYSKGILNNWELVYRGTPLNSHATIRRKAGVSIPVVVWNISKQDERYLDIYEGFPSYYFKQNVMIDIGDRKVKAMVYIMNKSCKPGRPSDYYVYTIKQGYIDNGFDIDILNRTLKFNRLECLKQKGIL